MKKIKNLRAWLLLVVAIIVLISLHAARPTKDAVIAVDFSKIPNDRFGEEVRYGKELLLQTAKYIGPEGTAGKFLGNRMNCTNCHQEAGTKAYSFNLMLSQDRYPQYRPREGKVLTLAERVNNCIERPHNGKPLPLDSREMVAILSYLKWINSFVPPADDAPGSRNLEVLFPSRAADPKKGAQLFTQHCQRCHGANGEGQLQKDGQSYTYPPLWGDNAYQNGSSMHRIIKLSQWIKANMPHDLATWNKPFLKDEEALDLAAFINDDEIHPRPSPANFDYPHPEEKAIDYDRGPFIDGFSTIQHKFGPFQPIVEYWNQKGLKAVY